MKNSPSLLESQLDAIPHEAVDQLVLSLISHRKRKNYWNTGKIGIVRSALRLGSKETGLDPIWAYDVYRNQVKVRRSVKTPTLEIDKPFSAFLYFQVFGEFPHEDDLRAWNRERRGRRGKIEAFSDGSRRRLKEKAGNCFPLMQSQFCATFSDETMPSDGAECKRLWNLYLNAVRRKFGNIPYLWILEFQKDRERRYQDCPHAPHFHLYFPFMPTREIRRWLAETWVRIAGAKESKSDMLKFHDHRNNFIPWDMGKGGYVAKYLEKTEQKEVPESYDNVGRFWGTSRTLMMPYQRYLVEDLMGYQSIDKLTGEIFTEEPIKSTYRILRKHHEASLRNCGIRKKSRIAKQGLTTVTLSSGGAVLEHYFRWLTCQSFKDDEPPPF